MRRMSTEVKLPQATTSVWEWQLRASCRSMPISMFFPESGLRGGALYRSENAAKAVCRQCPVADRCLDHAVTSVEPYGIWGGLTERERARKA